MGFLLALADAGIPCQKDSIPDALLRKLQPGRVSGFLCLGDCGQTVMPALKRIAQDVQAVAGTEDDEIGLPAVRVFDIQGIRFGMCHGHLVVPCGDAHGLNAYRCKLGVDVLLCAGTGRALVQPQGKGLLIDPGSVTGCMCSPMANGRPSFTLIGVDAGKVSTWTYSLIEDGSVSFSRSDWSKPGYVPAQMEAAPATSGSAPEDSVQPPDASAAPSATAGAPPAASDGTPPAAAGSTGGTPVSLSTPAAQRGQAPEQNIAAAASPAEVPATTSSQGPAAVADLPDDSGPPRVTGSELKDSSPDAASLGDDEAAAAAQGSPAGGVPAASDVQGGIGEADSGFKEEELDDVTL